MLLTSLKVRALVVASARVAQEVPSILPLAREEVE